MEEQQKQAAKPTLRKKYEESVVAKLKEDLELQNIMEVPRLLSITINMGRGKAVGNPAIVKAAFEELKAIAGQLPVTTKARKSIANFKLREGLAIGVAVTLRRERMWLFLERLIHIALPRGRDFRGLSKKKFDGNGNYNFGLKEQIIFPEINYDKVDEIGGMNISFATSAKDNQGGLALLEALGMPFRD